MNTFLPLQKSCGVCGAVKAAALTANTDSMGLSLSLATSSSDITCADTQSSEGCEAHKMLCRPDAGGFLSACKVRDPQHAQSRCMPCTCILNVQTPRLMHTSCHMLDRILSTADKLVMQVWQLCTHIAHARRPPAKSVVAQTVIAQQRVSKTCWMCVAYGQSWGCVHLHACLLLLPPGGGC